MPNTTSNEALALLWAYELNRENKCLFKGLTKVQRRLSKRELKTPQHVNHDPRLHAAAEQAVSNLSPRPDINGSDDGSNFQP